MKINKILPESGTSWRETKKIQIKLAATCNKNEQRTRCQK